MSATVDVHPDGTITIRVDGAQGEPAPVARLRPGQHFTVLGGWLRGEPVATHVLPGVHDVTYRERGTWAIPGVEAPDEDAAKAYAVTEMSAVRDERRDSA